MIPRPTAQPTSTSIETDLRIRCGRLPAVVLAFLGLLCLGTFAVPVEAESGSSSTANKAAKGEDEVHGKEILGFLEDVLMEPGDLALEAKLDTGAETSSLDATNIRRVRVGDQRYVRFDVFDPETGEEKSLRRPLVRRVRIKRHDGDHQKRSVVTMRVCLGSHAQTIEVSLIDRSEFDYPVLLGRSALKGRAVVDPQRKFTTDPECGELEPPEDDE